MTDQQRKTCCFTGHRRIRKNLIPAVTEKLENILHELIAQGVVYFRCGGALGFDMLAGFLVLKLKEQYPHIKLIMVLPCRDQAAKWSADEQAQYRKLLTAADKNVCLLEDYEDGCMLRRNRHLVDYSAVCVAYLTCRRSGTAFTVRYATEQGRTVINIADL